MNIDLKEKLHAFEQKLQAGCDASTLKAQRYEFDHMTRDVVNLMSVREGILDKEGAIKYLQIKSKLISLETHQTRELANKLETNADNTALKEEYNWFKEDVSILKIGYDSSASWVLPTIGLDGIVELWKNEENRFVKNTLQAAVENYCFDKWTEEGRYALKVHDDSPYSNTVTSGFYDAIKHSDAECLSALLTTSYDKIKPPFLDSAKVKTAVNDKPMHDIIVAHEQALHAEFTHTHSDEL